MTEQRDSLVGRAVEAAARARWNTLAPDAPWETLREGGREFVRKDLRPTIAAVLGVVADHCTTEAARHEEIFKVPTDDGIAVCVAAGMAKSLYEVAAELRETPDGLG